MVVGNFWVVVVMFFFDMGIDWGDIDLVVNIGVLKGVSCLV